LSIVQPQERESLGTDIEGLRRWQQQVLLAYKQRKRLISINSTRSRENQAALAILTDPLRNGLCRRVIVVVPATTAHAMAR
jgi:hypothetical protein